ncbi:peptidylprolyl isomerase [bacterium]|nr:peptidylprolyl isomerase [bacterium]
MKKLLPILIILLLIPVIGVYSQQVIDGIVAIVGEEIILKTELIQASQAYALQNNINPQTQTDTFNKIKHDILQNLINEKVLLAKAKEDTITVESQQVDAALQDRINQIVKQLGSKEKVEKYFGKSITQIKNDYREDIKKQLIAQKVQQKKLAGATISRREVERFYETMKDSLPQMQNMVKISHILMDVRSHGAARDAAVKKLTDIRNKILKGASFEDLASLYSEDPATARKGGDLGYIERGTLYQSFEDAAFSLKPGEISNIVTTPIGLHLIKLEDKKDNQIRVRHILIRLEPTKDDEKYVLNKLEEIRNDALNGADFGELAKKYSSDVSTKDSGGELGWLPVDQLQIQEFVNAIDTLKPGEISKPFKTPFGYHIVKLEDKQDKRQINLKDDWDRIREWALNVKRQKILQKWIDQIKKDLYINIKEDLI